MKNIRPLGWVIIVINSYLILNFFLTIDQNDSDAVNGFAFIFLMFVLAVIDVPLYILYRVTGKRKRECPVCGSKVPVGLTVCEKCLFDFRKKATGDIN